MPNQYSEDYQITNWLPPYLVSMTQWGRISNYAWLQLEQKRIKAKGIISTIEKRQGILEEEYALFRAPKTER